MAYNRKNLLEDIIWVQDVYNEKHLLGINNRRILNDYINIPGRKAISERTLYYYLTVPAKRDLQKIIAAEEKQLTLF